MFNEISRFNDFLQNFIKEGNVGKDALLNFTKDHKKKIRELEYKKFKTEELLIRKLEEERKKFKK